MAAAPFEADLDCVVPVLVYQGTAEEAAGMDVDGARISVTARDFGVDPNTVKKAIDWFYAGRSRS